MNNLQSLIDAVEVKRAGMGLFNDVLALRWTEMAYEEGCDADAIVTYVGDVINYTTGRN